MNHAAAELGPPPALDPATTAFFLDFDGTLAPLAARPELAAMAPTTATALRRLADAAEGALAIVSGRTLHSLDDRLGEWRPAAAGSHGIERRDAGGRVYVDDGGGRAAGAIDAVAAFGATHDLLVERKPAGAAVHFRARPDMEAAAKAAVEAAAATVGARVVHGNMIAEFALAHADKGDAVRAFMGEPPFEGRRPVFAGDDLTDEDGFRAVRALGGAAIKVGSGPTDAGYRAPDINAFLAWLERLA